ncbi:MAG: sugar transferase [Lachnospiraceae bacterium]|nr:sugar transferase [Lachnospiraceae bacterium]
MFQREALIRRYVFLILDLVCIGLSLVLANVIRFDHLELDAYDNLYIKAMMVGMLGCALGYFLLQLDKHLFERGFFQELVAVVKTIVCIAISMLGYLFFSREAQSFSRLQMGYFFLICSAMMYVTHLIAKKVIVRGFRDNAARKKILLVTTSDKVDRVLARFRQTNNWYFDLAYLVILDEDRTGDTIDGIPVIASADNMIDAVKDIVLDGVFLNTSNVSRSRFHPRDLLKAFQSIGAVVHVNIDALELDDSHKMIENLGFFKVVSYSARIRSTGEILAKRFMDILGAVVGLAITAVVGVFLIPAIMIESPGSPIFSQERVGRNGRHFRIYKFRSMRRGADAEKAALMAQNEMQGAIFKMENDPRITRVGKFIRRTSIDELPQFWNVLKGEMSIVGTRPPTVDEVEKYRPEQKRRLSVLPGITGLWQTSGRSNVYDFEEIVRMDLKYIDEWSLMLDIRLILKTIVIIFTGKGAK